MYDLPSEDPNEPGLPDEFHALQPQLLSATLRLSCYTADNFFMGMDLNLYYDIRHPLWHKRPDWFLALGVSRLYEGRDLRWSYVIWQEGVSPFVIVELLSPGTEADDLGQRSPQPDHPPSKWHVYEQILRVPYYLLFDRYTNQFRALGLNQGRYQPLPITDQKLWLSELELGLGVWHGEYQGVTRNWLRWYTSPGGWIATPQEALELERQRAEQERQRAEQAEGQVIQIARNLVQAGLELEQIANFTGLSTEQIQAIQNE
jgi:Uma2 family endonuclease